MGRTNKYLEINGLSWLNIWYIFISSVGEPTKITLFMDTYRRVSSLWIDLEVKSMKLQTQENELEFRNVLILKSKATNFHHLYLLMITYISTANEIIKWNFKYFVCSKYLHINLCAKRWVVFVQISRIGPWWRALWVGDAHQCGHASCVI